MGSAENLPAVLATLQFVEKYSETLIALLEGKGEVIFSADVTEFEQRQEEAEEGLKTFSRLLREKIDKEFLPAKDSITKG